MSRPAFFHSGGDVFANGSPAVYMDAAAQADTLELQGLELTAFSRIAQDEPDTARGRAASAEARNVARAGAQLIQARIAATQWRKAQAFGE